MSIKEKIVNVARSCGFDIKKFPPKPPVGTTAQDLEILSAVKEFTMTSVERCVALTTAVRYISRRRIVGAVVECGVWRGGSSMAAAIALLQEQDSSRDLYLYDTFEGMTEPTQLDGNVADSEYQRISARGEKWCFASIEDVQRNMTSTNYPNDRVHLIQGPVEQTIPKFLPNSSIALLRLDTDWYESTKHELEYLFPLLCDGGVLILDDYGHWQGARKAVDEYFATHKLHYLMTAIDSTGRILVKH